MASSTKRSADREELVERAPIVGGLLVVVAALTVGAASFADGANPGFWSRLPVYILAGAIAFVGALLWMRDSPRDGTTVLRRAAATGFLGSVGLGLGTEAVLYAFIIVAPTISLYLASALILACGLVYWSIRNWRAVNDLTRPW